MSEAVHSLRVSMSLKLETTRMSKLGLPWLMWCALWAASAQSHGLTSTPSSKKTQPQPGCLAWQVPCKLNSSLMGPSTGGYCAVNNLYSRTWKHCPTTETHISG